MKIQYYWSVLITLNITNFHQNNSAQREFVLCVSASLLTKLYKLTILQVALTRLSRKTLYEHFKIKQYDKV
jgi:hypothetical protein